MSRKKYKSSWKGLADQYLTLITIYVAIINQQFDDADESTITSLVDGFQRAYRGKNNKSKKW